MKARLKNLFTEHPNSINETYKMHFQFAMQVGCKLLFAGVACIIHSIFPFIFKTTASHTIQEISELFKNRNIQK